MIKYPSFDEVQEQLQHEFSAMPVNISAEEIKDLSRHVSDIFSEMENRPYEGFAVYTKETPCVCLQRWLTEDVMHKRKLYARDYSSISLRSLTYTDLTINIVAVWGVKRVELHFVAPMTTDEEENLNDEIDEIMDGMNIDPEEQRRVKEIIMQRSRC